MPEDRQITDTRDHQTRFEIDSDISRAWTPPARVYTDPRVYALARERVFATSWQFIAHLDQARVPGQVYPFTLLEGCLDAALLLVRDRADRLQCLSNVCTHRGMLVCEHAGVENFLRCRYHGRRFALDGRFESMPEFDGVSDFPSPADDLPRVPLATWGPLVFASLGDANRVPDPSRDRKGVDRVRSTAPGGSPPISAHRMPLRQEKPGSPCLAYLITFHTYGTWLHGNDKGSVDRNNNTPGMAFLTPDDRDEYDDFVRLKHEPVILDVNRRTVVDATLREVSQFRGWTIHAANVRTNHVHVVVSADTTPERVMNDFKSYSTRRMVEKGLFPASTKAWTRHGSTRYLWTTQALDAAGRYVVESQGPDLPLSAISELNAAADAADPLPHGRGSEMAPLPHGRGSESFAIDNRQSTLTNSFDSWLGPVRDRVGWLPLHEFKFDASRSRDYLVQCNWALYCENYLEGFHIPFVHAGLAETLDYGSYRTELFEHGSLQLGVARGGENVFNLPPTSPDHGQRIAAYYFWLFPNLMLNFYPWGLSINVVRPLGVERTKVSFLTYVWDESKMEAGAGAGLDRVEREDEAIVEAVQRGLRTRLYDRGRYSPTREQGTHHFHRMLASALCV